MKKTVLAMLVVIVCTGLSATAHAFTVDTTFDVNITVVEACTVTATGLSFPDYASGSSSVFGESNITVTCGNTIPYNIALDGGLNLLSGARRLIQGGNRLIYWLYQEGAFTNQWGDSGFGDTYTNGVPKAGIGTGSPQIHTVYGWLAAGQNAPTGLYSDTITVTVNY